MLGCCFFDFSALFYLATLFYQHITITFPSRSFLIISIICFFDVLAYVELTNFIIIIRLQPAPFQACFIAFNLLFSIRMGLSVLCCHFVLAYLQILVCRLICHLTGFSDFILSGYCCFISYVVQVLWSLALLTPLTAKYPY